MSRLADIIGLFFFLPFVLPLHIRKDKMSEEKALLSIFFPNGFIWLSIYLYLLHVILSWFGITDANVTGQGSFLEWVAPPPVVNPSAYFGTFFFVIFFPLMAYYLYITQMELWDTVSLREHFAEHVPTKEEIKKEEEEKQKRRERRKRIFQYFIKRFFWTLVVFLGIFAYMDANTADGGMPWFDTFLLALLFSVMLAPVLAVSAEQKREQKEREKQEK